MSKGTAKAFLAVGLGTFVAGGLSGAGVVAWWSSRASGAGSGRVTHSPTRTETIARARPIAPSATGRARLFAAGMARNLAPGPPGV